MGVARLAAAFAIGWLGLAGATASAGSFTHEAFVGVRVNPLGQSQELAVGWRAPLLPDDGTPIRGDSSLWLAPKVQVSPTFVGTGMVLRVKPLAVVQLQLHAERIQAWADASAMSADGLLPVTAATLEMIEIAGAVIGSGWRTTNHLLVQAQVGPVAARATTTLVGWRMDRGADGIFYDQTWDILAPNHGWGGNLDVDLLLVAPEQRPVVGARFTAASPLGPVSGWPDGATQRVGPLAGWTFRERRPGGWLQRPTLFALAQWHLTHPWRTGDPTPRALPTVGVGLSVVGDVPPSSP